MQKKSLARSQALTFIGGAIVLLLNLACSNVDVIDRTISSEDIGVKKHDKSGRDDNANPLLASEPPAAAAATPPQLSSSEAPAPTPSVPTSPSSPILNSWVEMSSDGDGLARIITTDTQCPVASISGVNTPMQVRAEASSDGNFPHLVCEVEVPSEAPVIIAGQTMPVIPSSPQKILFIGDTGCRIKVSAKGKTKIQNCDSQSGWPFASLAVIAAQLKPDLVVHVGDYHYREAACPPGNSDCQGSVYGDNWNSWNEDFFSPAKPLLRAAPWIFVRGNHEICARAQEGFFRFLDPNPMPESCPDFVSPYSVPFENITLAVLDSSANDITATDIAAVSSLDVQNAWLVTHRPPWISEAAKAAGDGDEDVEPAGPSITAPIGVPKNIALVVTGHQHLFRATTFADQRPPQIIDGNGGTLLEKNPAPESLGTSVDSGGTTLASVNTFNDFGFLLMQSMSESSWSANVYAIDGTQKVLCGITTSASNKSTQMNCNQ